MTRVFLVRHGKAGDLDGDYDVLSEIGRAQAARCGAAWRELEVARVVHGDLLRQRETARIFAEAHGNLPSAVVDERLDEFAHANLLIGMEGLIEMGTPMSEVFLRGLLRWSSGEHDDDYAETYPVFVERCEGAFARVVDEVADQTAVVVSSGGPIAAIVGGVLGVPTRARMNLCWSIANTGVTEIRRHHDGQLRVSFFNDHHHLRPDLTTWV